MKLNVATEPIATRMTRYRILYDDSVMSYADVIEGWCSDRAFRREFNSVLVESPYAGFRWETPPLTTSMVDRPFGSRGRQQKKA